MKRFCALLLAAALCLACAACRGTPPDVSPEDPGAPADKPLAVDALNAEFVAGGRDVDALLRLQADFPRALIDALGAQAVEVGAVNVTFGTSGEATAEALQNGAVNVAFVPAEAFFAHEDALRCVAAEAGEGPDLALSVIVVPVGANERLTGALRDALPDLAGVLAPYTGEYAEGVYEYDAARLARFAELYETGDTTLHTETAMIGGRELTLNGVGHRLDEYSWGIRVVEVREGDTLLQTIELSEAGDDLPLDDYNASPTPELTFRVVDANFDGCDDVEVFGWLPSNTVPYFYWLWNPETQRYEYSFCLQGPTIDPERKTLTSEYKDGPGGAQYWIETYEWQGGELVMTDRVDAMAGAVMH